MRHRSCLALLLSCAAAPWAFAQGRPPAAVQSAWQVVRDDSGHMVRRELVNRTFAFAVRDIGAAPTNLLFVQEVRTTELSSREGDNGRVHLEAWASVRPDTGYRRRLWTADVPGSSARLLQDYYEVTAYGCCGALDTRTVVSLETGGPITSFTSGPVFLRGGPVGEPAYGRPVSVVFLGGAGTVPVGTGPTDSLAFAEVSLLEGDLVRSRVVLRVARRALDPNVNVGFAVRTARDSVSEGTLYLRAADRPVVRVLSEVWRPVTIPISGRRLTLTGAALPPGVTAQLVESR